MNAEHAIEIGHTAVTTVLTLLGPILAVALVVGLLVAVFQTMTQIQDHSISLIPKLVAMILSLSILLPWLLQRLTEYTSTVFTSIPSSLFGG